MVNIDRSLIESTARVAYWSIKKFYENEENKKKFQEWKAKKALNA